LLDFLFSDPPLPAAIVIIIVIIVLATLVEPQIKAPRCAASRADPPQIIFAAPRLQAALQ
jgi:hypothetical protein